MNSPPRSSLNRERPLPLARASAAPRLGAHVRVMVVDDSLTVRTIFRRMVESDPAMEITGTASSGERAIVQIKKEPVDVVLLDLEMPGMGGLNALPEILNASPGVQVLVVSSLTQDGAEATVEALSKGAADTLQKPRPGGFNEEYRIQLLEKIRALGVAKGEVDGASGSFGMSKDSAAQNQSGKLRSPRSIAVTKRPDVIAIGASTGGIHALNLLLRELTPQCRLPIVITQHLPGNFIPVFARQIEVASGRTTHIAQDGAELRPGEIMIANGDGHINVRRMADRLRVHTLKEPAPSGCTPSVDPMLSSLAKACGGRVLAIILSGMGRDGCEGAKELVNAGGSVWAQNADTCAVWGMPGAVAKAGLTSVVAGPCELGQAIMQQFATVEFASAPNPARGAPSLATSRTDAR